MNLQYFLTKLPQLRGWIDATVSQHKAQARPVASYSFPRLQQFYSPATLSSAFVVEVPQVPMPPLADFGLSGFEEFQNGDYAGITFMNTYFVQEGRKRDESLHFHELVHVIQWQHLGPSAFIAAYVAGYMAAGSYRANPLEVIAYALQEYFDNNRPPGNVESLIRKQIDEQIAPMVQRIMKEGPQA